MDPDINQFWLLFLVERLLATSVAYENNTQDVDFSASGIIQCWDADNENTTRIIHSASREREFDPREGVISYESSPEEDSTNAIMTENDVASAAATR